MDCLHLREFITAHSGGTIHHCGHFDKSCVIEDVTIHVPGGTMPRCAGCQFHQPIPRTTIGSKFCYWSCDTTPRGPAILNSMIASARSVGVAEDFHVFTGGHVPGAVVHAPGALDITYHIFKWRLLRDRLAHLDYEYFVWVDSDTYFTRDPGDLSSLIRDNAMWCQLESETTAANVRHPDWWGATLPQYNQMLTDHGVVGEKKYNTNGGMWIVRKEAIETFVREALQFHSMCLAKGLSTTSDEPPLAWLGQLDYVTGYDGAWVADKHLNTNPSTCETWSCDWMGRFAGRVPDGKPWLGEDWLTGEQRTNNPAIVHAMRSKDAMAALALGKRREQQALAYPCPHRGVIARIDEQPPCKGGPEPIYRCDLHSECSIGKYCAGQKVPACTGCRDRTEPAARDDAVLLGMQ